MMHKFTRLTFKVLDLFVVFMMVFGAPFSALAAPQAQDAPPPTIQSDKADYSAGSLVTLTGTGWTGDTTVTIVVTDAAPTVYHDTDQVQVQADGTISDSFNLPTGFVDQYFVTATGAQTGRVATTTFTDAPAAVNLDQCRNGSAASPNDCKDFGGNTGWVNGNVGASQAHMLEGYSTPFRAVMTNLPTGIPITLIIGYDITASGGKHSYDYLTSIPRYDPHTFFGHAAENTFPTDGVTGFGATTGTFPIPAPSSAGSPLAGQPTNSFNAMPAAERVMTLYGGTISAISYVSEGDLAAANSETRISVTFTVQNPTAVLAWGGHIAQCAVWGTTNGTCNSAGGVSGSDYHMRLISWTDHPANPKDDLPNLGNTDRSMSAAVVVQPGNLTLAKSLTGGPAGYTGPFTINYSCTDGTVGSVQVSAGSSQTVNGIASGSVCTISETLPTPPDGYTFGTPTFSPSNTVTIGAGTTVTVTTNNTLNQASASVTTAIHNDSHTVVTSVPLGSIVHDSVTVTGGAGTATGNVTFDWFTNGSCTGTPAATSGSFTLSGGSADATTFTQGPLAAGSYSFKAVYSGDNNYGTSTSACEPLTVNKAQLSITTTVHDGSHSVIANNASVPLGTSAHDNATVTGGVAGFPIPAISFTFNGNAIANDSSTESGFDATSVSTGALGAGNYKFNATVASDANYIGATSDDEPFTINKATPTLTTNASGPVTVGADIHDTATISGLVNADGSAKITFKLYSDAACTNEVFSSDSAAVTANGNYDSGNYTTTAAGSYYWVASFPGDSNNEAASTSCGDAGETSVINRANTSTTTQVHNSAHMDVTNTVVVSGTQVHDSATVSGQVGSIPITGTVTYKFYNNATCTGTSTDETVPVGTESTAQTIMTPGSYCYKAVYSGDANYNGSTSAIEPFTVLPESKFTDTEFCPLPTDGFRLVFIQDPQVSGGSIYRLNATNPGQFYYNVFYAGTPGDTVTLNIEVPYPFITQGAVPIQAHNGLTFTTINGQTCYVPNPSLPGYTVTTEAMSPVSSSGNQIIGFEDYAVKNIGSSTTVTVTGTIPSTGLLYVTIHLDYGLKGTTGWTKVDALNPPDNDSDIDDAFNSGLGVTILNPQTYTASFDDGGSISDSQTFQSINVFKKNPGIGGSALQSSTSDPKKNAKVLIYQGTKLMGTVYTDEDGWYMWQFKYTGKATTFTVKLPDFGLSKSVTLKSNGFVVVDFTVP